MSKFNQQEFVHDYNLSHRDRFNPALFNRSEYDIIEQLEKIILSSQRDKFFTIKVMNFSVIEDYREISAILYELEENRRNKRIKFNRLDYIDLKDSDVILLKVDYYLEINGASTELPVYIAIPKVIDKYYFRLNGSMYCPMYQIVDGSTYNKTNNKKHQSVTLKTLFMKPTTYLNSQKLTTINNEIVESAYFSSNIFSNTILTFKYFFAKFGLLGAMSFLRVDSVLITDYPIEDDRYYCFTKKNCGIYISALKYFFDNSNIVQSIVTTLYICMTNETNIYNVFTTDYWKESLGEEYKTKTIQKGESILDSLEHIYDINTRDILRLPWEDKCDIYAILRWIVYEFQALLTKNNVDISTKRVRLAEYIAALYATKLSTNIYFITNPNNNVGLEKLINAVDIKYNFLVNELTSCKLVPYKNNVNDNDALIVLKYTFKGVAGIGEKKSSAVPNNYRFVNASHIGRVDKDSSSNSDPGMSGTICPYADIYEGGYLSNFQEPCTWNKVVDSLQDSYRKATGVKELFVAKEALLGRNESMNIEYAQDNIDSMTSVIATSIGDSQPNIQNNNLEVYPLDDNGTAFLEYDKGGVV